MSVGVIFSMARDALMAQRYGMDVTAQNIANVNTPGYSRQDPVLTSKPPEGVTGLGLGRGVGMTAVIRNSDQLLENRLMQQKSGLSSNKELETYMRVLEGVFNENTETSLSVLLSDFWNSWQELSTNPTGSTERMALYENGVMLSERFITSDEEMSQMVKDLTGSVRSGIGKVNQISAEIAELNKSMVGTEISYNANDLRDKRNLLVSELFEYMEVTTFSQSNGSLTILTAKGTTLVLGESSYDLEMGGADGDSVLWRNSAGASVDITDDISNGKINGWLEMRDEVLAKTRLDLDAMVKEFVWMVNAQHSQGVGLKLFEPGTTLTGTYQTNTDLGDLPFGGKIQFIADGLDLWIEDRTVQGNPVMGNVAIDLSGLDGSSTLSDLATAINNQIAGAGLAGVTVDGSGTAIAFTAANNFAFGFSDDASNILAALGVNTFFDGYDAGNINMNTTLTDIEYIAAARIDNVGNYAEGDNNNALAMTDLQFLSTQIERWTVDRENGNTVVNVTSTVEEYYHGLVGAIGLTGSSIARGRGFSELMVNTLQEIRDSISAVSLDEEMTNLIKYQQAYASAAKLIAVADEMLVTLLEIK